MCMIVPTVCADCCYLIIRKPEGLILVTPQHID